MQDAYNLGWRLAGEDDLDRYETERRAVAANVLGVSPALLRKYTGGEEDAHRRGIEHTGLTITYRTIEDDGSLAPGDRAPDSADNVHAWRAYDAQPGRTVTIRPDGYVAAISR